MSEKATISALIDALQRAQQAHMEADTQRRRKARLERVINAGIALRERLQELRVWLDEHFTGDEGDLKYSENLDKYKAGWDALNSAANAIDEWKRTHYEELDAEAFHARFGPGGRARDARKKGKPVFADKAASQQAQRGKVAVGKAVLAGFRGEAARGDGEALPEPRQLELV